MSDGTPEAIPTEYDLKEIETNALMLAESSLLQAKGAVCDAQERLQQAQTGVETAQRAQAVATAQRDGAISHTLRLRGVIDGQWGITQDLKKLVRKG